VGKTLKPNGLAFFFLLAFLTSGATLFARFVSNRKKQKREAKGFVRVVFSLIKVSTFRRTNLRYSLTLNRILSRLSGCVATIKGATSGDDPNASSAKRLGAQDRMIPIMPKRTQFDKSDWAKKRFF
jgi:hypothetical protein